MPYKIGFEYKSITFKKSNFTRKNTAVSFGNDSGNIHKGLLFDWLQAFLFSKTDRKATAFHEKRMWQSSNLFDTHRNIHRALLYLRVSSQSKDSGIYNRTARNTAILRGLMSRGKIIWVMPIPFNVGHCRGSYERFKSKIQNNSSYVVFSDSGKSLAISPLLEVWAMTRQNTETVSERVPTRPAREQRGKIIKAVRKPRRSMNEAREN